MDTSLKVVFICFCLSLTILKPTYSRHTDIVLLGSTGDLAKKYLWQSLFNLYSKENSIDQTFKFYACGRSPESVAGSKLESILDQNVACSKPKSNCPLFKQNFKNLVSYLQLKSDADFKNLGQVLRDDRKEKEGEIIFYLSIPPEAYSLTAENIYKFSHPDNNNVQFRIVFEKPFGHDLTSARHLIDKISKYYKEEEIFRIDHYLGKSIVRQILPFRMANKDIDDILNRNHVERVEIVLKETVDSKGRISYYNQNGVIRDILQNHLIEVMTLVAMDTPTKNSSTEISKLKIKLLKSVEPVKTLSLLTGQYSEYLNQSNEEMPDFKMADHVPTFAAVSLSIKSSRWMDVPFILVSGKGLNERTSYARIVFKRNSFCVSAKCPDIHQHPQIIFHIGHGNLKSPVILVSKKFQNVKFPEHFTKPNIVSNELVYGLNFSEFYSGSPHIDVDAYTALIEDIFKGRYEHFVGSKHLEALWTVWDRVLKSSSSQLPRIYEKKDLDNVLNFNVLGSSLKFVQGEHKIDSAQTLDEYNYTPTKFLGHKLVCSNVNQLFHLLAEDIAKSVKERLIEPVSFHIAFSGGKTPVQLFEILAQMYSDIPWKFIHVWQVDERCVSSVDDDSNFNHLWTNLLRYISIPYDNIHPMRVDVNGKICHVSDNADVLYKDAINYYIPYQKFDYIVLGVGNDGHTASMFPQSSVLDYKVMVALATENTSNHRMTLTYSAINRARHISILITGKEKHSILKALESSPATYLQYPILGVKPLNGHMTWYIDNEAFFDQDKVP